MRVTREILDHQDHLVLQEMAQRQSSLCMDLQGLQENLVLKDQLDPKAILVKQVNLVNQDQGERGEKLVTGDLLELLEKMDLMDPRESLEVLAQLVLPDCQVFLDLLGNGDQKVLKERLVVLELREQREMLVEMEKMENLDFQV
jgi:hypothetical protein